MLGKPSHLHAPRCQAKAVHHSGKVTEWRLGSAALHAGCKRRVWGVTQKQSHDTDHWDGRSSILGRTRGCGCGLDTQGWHISTTVVVQRTSFLTTPILTSLGFDRNTETQDGVLPSALSNEVWESLDPAQSFVFHITLTGASLRPCRRISCRMLLTPLGRYPPSTRTYVPSTPYHGLCSPAICL